jgi:hypothetical protein
MLLEQDICTGCHKVTGVRYFAREDVWHCEACQAYDLDTITCSWCDEPNLDTMADPNAKDVCLDCTGATTVPCPKHEGAFDCTPFCEVCEGSQEIRVSL